MQWLWYRQDGTVVLELQYRQDFNQSYFEYLIALVNQSINQKIIIVA